MVPLLVIVTGPPGAGKTTIARAIAARLGLPLIAKDELKETLHDALGGEGREWSQRLGAATFEVMFKVLHELLANGSSVVAEGNFVRTEPFRALPATRRVQVYVTAPPEVIRDRFLSRRRPHPVHYDLQVVAEVPARMAAGEWDPLDLEGELVHVDTATFPDVAEIADRVERAQSGRVKITSTLRLSYPVKRCSAPASTNSASPSSTGKDCPSTSSTPRPSSTTYTSSSSCGCCRSGSGATRTYTPTSRPGDRCTIS